VSAGYSYTTISSGANEPARVHVDFHLDDEAWIRACGHDDGKPQLSIHHGETGVVFAPTLGPITQADARLARELADQAAIYAAQVERLHAEHETRAADPAA
jgi:hypothetical protein